MLRCTNNGCGNEFPLDANSSDACSYHPKGPIFHEGLKGWSCCKKRVASFDEFLQIPGCAKGHHSSEIKKAPEPEKSSKPLVEISNINNNVPQMVVQQLPRQQKANEKPEQEKQVYTEDTPDMVFTPGTICKRRGCGHKFKTSTISQGDGTEAICKYHDGTPVFHEGSKGWSCCSRKVLEFEEFIKIGGCREGKHLFGGNSVAQYRIEWFQSVGSVTVCVYCKNVSPKEVSMVFGEQTFSLNFKTEDGDIATVDKELFQPIDTQNSTYNVFRTKIEVVLKKTNGISWPSLEPTTEIKTWTTFGVQGKTGSVGSMNAQVAGDSPLFTATK